MVRASKTTSTATTTPAVVSVAIEVPAAAPAAEKKARKPKAAAVEAAAPVVASAAAIPACRWHRGRHRRRLYTRRTHLNNLVTPNITAAQAVIRSRQQRAELPQEAAAVLAEAACGLVRGI